MDLLDEIARAVQDHKISVVRFLVANQFLEVRLTLQNGNEMVALIFRYAFSYTGNHHSANKSGYVFQHGKLINLEIRACSEVCTNLVGPGARGDFRSLGKAKDENGDLAGRCVGQNHAMTGKTVAFDSGQLPSSLRD